MRARFTIVTGASLAVLVVAACGGSDQADLFGSQGAGGSATGAGGSDGNGGGSAGPGGASVTGGTGGTSSAGPGVGGASAGPGGASAIGGAAGSGSPGKGGAAQGPGGAAMQGPGGGPMQGPGGTSAGTSSTGAGGKGGSVGGGGAAGSGTAGKGTAGTDASAGTSASGGAGAGGTGAAGAPTCDAPMASCDACVACSETAACAASYTACKNNPSCSALFSCAQGCGQDQGCVDQCAQQHPNGVSGFNAFIFCAACSACPSSCNGMVQCPMMTCNPETQSGCNGGASKCTVTLAGGGNQYEPTCVTPMANSVGLGNKCTRMNGMAGYDDCAAGQFCTFLGTSEGDPSNPTRFCRAFCADSGACGSGKTCVPIDGQTPPDALCVPVCQAFKGGCGNGTCAATQTNVEGQGALTCRYLGGGLPGTDCNSDTQCGKDQICADSQFGKRCRSLCDGGHPCLGAPAVQCQMSPLLPSGVGVCAG